MKRGECHCLHPLLEIAILRERNLRKSEKLRRISAVPIVPLIWRLPRVLPLATASVAAFATAGDRVVCVGMILVAITAASVLLLNSGRISL